MSGLEAEQKLLLLLLRRFLTAKNVDSAGEGEQRIGGEKKHVSETKRRESSIGLVRVSRNWEILRKRVSIFSYGATSYNKKKEVCC